MRIQIGHAMLAQDVGDFQHRSGRALRTVDQLVDDLPHVVHDALRQMQVHDGALDVGVSEEALNRSQIQALLQQVCGVGMSKGVARCALADACLTAS